MNMTEHLASRHYDLSRYATQWLTETELTVPLFDFGQKLKGYQVYTPSAPKQAKNPKEAKYFTRMYGNTQGVWGTELELEISVPSINARILN